MAENMDPEQARRWIASRRAGADREMDELRRAGADPRKAIRQALELIALMKELHGWPLPEDPVSQRENEAARDSWVRLKTAWVDR